MSRPLRLEIDLEEQTIHVISDGGTIRLTPLSDADETEIQGWLDAFAGGVLLYSPEADEALETEAGFETLLSIQGREHQPEIGDWRAVVASLATSPESTAVLQHALTRRFYGAIGDQPPSAGGARGWDITADLMLKARMESERFAPLGGNAFLAVMRRARSRREMASSSNRTNGEMLQ